MPDGPTVTEQLLDAPADPDLCKAALRKATLRLIPMLALGYGIAYIDRVNISYAALRMDHALGFSSAVYGFGAGIFCLTYAVCQVPANLALVRVGPRRWLSFIMLVWGIFSLCTMFVRTPGEFYAARMLLGAAEAGFFPGVIFYLSRWFPKSQRSRAVSMFYVSMPLSFTFMGVVAGWLLRLHGRLGLMGWQWLLLVEALPAILLSGFYFAVLPDSPVCAKWLSKEECTALTQSLEADSRSMAAEGPSETSVLHAFREPRVWLLGGFLSLTFSCQYAFVFTAPELIRRATGLNAGGIGYLLSIFGLLGAAAMIANAWSSDKQRERYLHILVPTIALGIACALAGATTRAAIAVPALALLFVSFSAVGPPLWALPSSFLKGKSAAAGIAAVNSMGFLGGLAGPYWMGAIHHRTGSYQDALLWLPLPVTIACVLITMVNVYSKRDQIKAA